MEYSSKKIAKDWMLKWDLNKSIDQLAMANSAHWYGHVLKKEDGHILRREQSLK